MQRSAAVLACAVMAASVAGRRFYLTDVCFTVDGSCQRDCVLPGVPTWTPLCQLSDDVFYLQAKRAASLRENLSLDVRHESDDLSADQMKHINTLLHILFAAALHTSVLLSRSALPPLWLLKLNEWTSFVLLTWCSSCFQGSMRTSHRGLWRTTGGTCGSLSTGRRTSTANWWARPRKTTAAGSAQVSLLSLKHATNEEWWGRIQSERKPCKKHSSSAVTTDTDTTNTFYNSYLHPRRAAAILIQWRFQLLKDVNSS